MHHASAPDLSCTTEEQARERAWATLLAIREQRGAEPLEPGACMGLDARDRLCAVASDSPAALLQWQPALGWRAAAQAPAAATALLDLYLPIVNASAEAPLVIGHLGQSLDGFIATRTGDSDYVTGPQNILHLHRMRALCDAVLVGAETVAADDPSLTARHAGGRNPVRVVIDPRQRLGRTLGVFTDNDAPTLLVCNEASLTRDDRGAMDIVGVPAAANGLDLAAVLNILRERSLNTVFVEGGGKTVSAFLEQGLLDRLQVAIAPIVIGHGRPGLELSLKQRLDECPRFDPRYFIMGEDVLFDCDLRAREHGTAARRLQRAG